MIDLDEYPEIRAELKAFGIEHSKFTPEEFDDLVRSLDEAILEREDLNALGTNAASKEWIKGMLGALLLHVVPYIDAFDSESALEFELLVNIIEGSGCVDTLLQNFSKGGGATAHTAETSSDVIRLVLWIMIGIRKGAPLLMRFRDAIVPLLVRVEEKLGNRGFLLYLEQAKRALENDDSEELIKAYEGALSLVGATSSGLSKDLDHLAELGKRVHASLKSQTELQAATGITQV